MQSRASGKVRKYEVFNILEFKKAQLSKGLSTMYVMGL